MPTLTLGTAATTSLTAVQIPPSYNATPAIADVDWATMSTHFLDDLIISHPIVPSTIVRSGRLFVPNRGFLNLLPGDWIAFDAGGFPFLIPSYSLPQTLTRTITTTAASRAATCATSIRAVGWQVGQGITSANIAAATTITGISPDGLSLTLSANATGSGAALATISNGWTHS